MIEKLRKICDGEIKLSSNNEKYLIIRKILNDDKCFLKMNIETSLAILRDLGIKEENLMGIYEELIDIKNF